MNISASPCTDELVEFLDDESPAPSAFSPDCWKVLVVDDDAEVHQATEFALQGAVFCGRSLELLHAYSAAEAKALLEAFKDVRGMEPVPIGTYRGFQMSLTLEDFGKDYVLTLKGQMTHRVTLGKDARGNLTRIDNVLNAIPDRLQNVRNTLDALTAQMETAKAGALFSQP